ncbi:AMP-binding enzyme [Sporolactobacillus sp. KGMB 08714]|uniref:AMP-binding enzyme n=1 Tax=Sporolactobacillus sp. KGMB 08714 TaxID=3064704 RepID=UPI002FBD5413
MVKEAAVIGLPDPIRGESVEAFIALKDGDDLTEKQVKDYCRKYLTDFKRPRHVYFVDHFPKTVSGKIRKALFRKHWLTGDLSGDYRQKSGNE